MIEKFLCLNPTHTTKVMWISRRHKSRFALAIAQLQGGPSCAPIFGDDRACAAFSWILTRNTTNGSCKHILSTTSQPHFVRSRMHCFPIRAFCSGGAPRARQDKQTRLTKAKVNRSIVDKREQTDSAAVIDSEVLIQRRAP